jgi:lysophospholipase L1-like esterase
MGDSIAVGVAQARKECHAQVQGGISSPNYLKKYGDKIEPAKIVVISLGANDFKVDTKASIEKIRARVKADHVFWILPNDQKKPEAVKAVREVAKANNDTVLDRPVKNMSPDGIHPNAKGYKELADKTKAVPKAK